jgi:hypothetical protein
MSKRNGTNECKPVHVPGGRGEAMPDYAIWQNALKGTEWPSVALAVVLYRGILEIVALAGLPGLCFIATRFIEHDGDLSTRALFGALTISAMVLAMCCMSLIMAARSWHGTSAEQSKGGAAELGDGQRRPREDGEAEGRDRLAQSDRCGQPSPCSLRLPMETEENGG